MAVVEGGGGGGPGGAVAPTSFENPLLGIFQWVCTENVGGIEVQILSEFAN